MKTRAFIYDAASAHGDQILFTDRDKSSWETQSSHGDALLVGFFRDAAAIIEGWPADLSDEEILERLLVLNLERSAEEKQAAKATSKKRSSRTKAEDEMI